MPDAPVDDKLVIRMSSADKKKISDAAWAARVSMSQWCRDILLDAAERQDSRKKR
jgi:predicted HicB family RNase H-like nuclease